jgi:hypothetical protein
MMYAVYSYCRKGAYLINPAVPASPDCNSGTLTRRENKSVKLGSRCRETICHKNQSEEINQSRHSPFQHVLVIYWSETS